MSRKKHRPSRPHWERIASRRANNKNVTLTPETSYSFWGSGVVMKRSVRPSRAEPGK